MSAPTSNDSTVINRGYKSKDILDYDGAGNIVGFENSQCIEARREPARCGIRNHVMKCPICKQGKTRPGTAVTLERDGLTLIVKAVPAQVCANCGEEYVNERTTTELLAKVESEARPAPRSTCATFQAA